MAIKLSRRMSELLTEATPEQAQLLLATIVWPDGTPDPRLVDAWVRRRLAHPERVAHQQGGVGLSASAVQTSQRFPLL